MMLVERICFSMSWQLLVSKAKVRRHKNPSSLPHCHWLYAFLKAINNQIISNFEFKCSTIFTSRSAWVKFGSIQELGIRRSKGKTHKTGVVKLNVLVVLGLCYSIACNQDFFFQYLMGQWSATLRAHLYIWSQSLTLKCSLESLGILIFSLLNVLLSFAVSAHWEQTKGAQQYGTNQRSHWRSSPCICRPYRVSSHHRFEE